MKTIGLLVLGFHNVPNTLLYKIKKLFFKKDSTFQTLDFLYYAHYLNSKNRGTGLVKEQDDLSHFMCYSFLVFSVDFQEIPSFRRLFQTVKLPV